MFGMNERLGRDPMRWFTEMGERRVGFSVGMLG